MLTLLVSPTSPKSLKSVKTDIKLIEAIANGDHSSFRMLYERYETPLFITSMRYSRGKQEAEDMLQECFIKVYKEIKKFDSQKGEFLPWAKRILINICLKLAAQDHDRTASSS